MSVRTLREPAGLCLLLAGALLFGSVAAGCSVNVDPRREGFRCNPGGTCRNGLVCVGGRCVRAGGGSDGGTTDAGARDGGSSDAGPNDGGPPDAGPPPSTSATIGYMGGALALGGAKVTFPRAAFGQDTSVTLTHLPDAPPSADGPMGDLWRLDPAGVSLHRPARVVLPFSGSVSDAAAYWQTPQAGSYEHIGAASAGGTNAGFGVVRLGQGFVGSAAAHPAVTVYGVVSNDWLPLHSPPTVTPSIFAGLGSPVDAYAAGAGGTTNVYSGTWGPDGIFRIPDVPGSRWTVAIPLNGTTSIDTTQATIDATVEYSEWGPVPVAGTGTKLDLALSGLDPIQPSDQLWLVVPDDDTDRWLGGFNAATGATSLQYTQDVSGSIPVIDASHDGPTYFAQLRGGSQLVSFAQVSLTIQDGTKNSITVPMQTVQTTQTVPTQVQHGAFENVLLDVTQPVSQQTLWIVVRTSPWTSESGPFVPGYPDYLQFGDAGWPGLTLMAYNIGATPGQAPATIDLNNQQFAYGDPMGSTWRTDFTTSVFAIAGLDDGSTLPANVWVGTYQTTRLVNASAVAAPQISLPTGLTVNGVASTSPLTGATQTPTIAWTAPATGDVGGYHLLLMVDPSSTTPYQVSDAWTTQTSFTFPPGILQSGKKYCVVVEAELNPIGGGTAIDVAAAPLMTYYRRGGYARNVTQIFSP